MAANDSGAQVQLRDEGPMLVASTVLAGCQPAAVLAAFTDPDLVRQWWHGELHADLVPGGSYRVAFPMIPATLAGAVVSYRPGESLEFGWAWDGEADNPPSTVLVSVAPWPEGSGSTLLTIEHGPHGDDEAGQTARTEHREGWEYFLPRLAETLAETLTGTQGP